MTEPCPALRILVVEDEFLVSALLEEDLLRAGHVVLGPFRDLYSAIDASRREDFDLAILDVNLSGEMVYPLADELLKRNLSILFLSGYGLQAMPERFRVVPRIAKPYDPRVLVEEIDRMASRRTSHR